MKTTAMTNEDKQTLLRELSARLPYGLKVSYKDEVYNLTMVTNADNVVITKPFMSNHEAVPVEEVRPLLRPMSVISQKERIQLLNTKQLVEAGLSIDTGEYVMTLESYDYLNSIHADYRELIKRELALQADEKMYF